MKLSSNKLPRSRPFPPRVLLLGGDVRSNIGDRAIRQSLVQMIRAEFPSTTIHAISHTPELDQREFGIKVIGHSALSLFIHPFLLRKMNVVIWGGGQLLQDDTSLIKNIYWAVVLGWLRRVLRLPVIGLGLGVGPFNTRAGRFLARSALKNLEVFVGRDPGSCEWVRGCDLKNLKVQQAPDLAVYLEAASADEAWEYLRTREGIELGDDEIVVGISVRRWFHLRKNPLLPHEWMRWWRTGSGREHGAFDQFLDNLSSALMQFGRGRKVRLLLFPMARSEWEGDRQLSQRVASSAGLPAHVLKLDCDAALVKALTGMCDFLVSVRMHTAILGMSMGVPSAGIVHVPKTSHFYHSLGQDELLVSIDLAAQQSGSERLFEVIEKTFLQRETYSEEIKKHLHSMNTLQTIYTELLSNYL